MSRLQADLAVTLIEHAPDAILVVAEGGAIEFANPRAEGLFGYAPGGLDGCAIEQLVPHRHREEHAAVRQGYSSAPRKRHMGELDGGVVGLRHDGTTFPADIMLVPMDGGAIMAVVRDVTELRQLQGEREAARAALQRTNEELAASNAAKAEVMAVAAHDLRNPLTVIRAYVHLLRADSDGLPDEPWLFSLGQMSEATDYMLALINDLLDVAKVEEGNLRLELAPTDIGALVEESVAGQRILARAKHVVLELSVTAAARALRVDAMRIGQVVQNLLSNAVKFSPIGGEVAVLVEDGLDGSLVISVADHGAGIPETEVERVFHRYTVGSTRATAGETSTGLGLAIVSKIVREHGGRVWVDSAPGIGSTFYVSLPRR